MLTETPTGVAKNYMDWGFDSFSVYDEKCNIETVLFYFNLKDIIQILFKLLPLIFSLR